MSRMCFVEDEDGHWFLIKEEEKEEFELYMEAVYAIEEMETVKKYADKFNNKMCRNPIFYTFLDPKEI